MTKATLKLNNIQASMLQRMLKEEILNQRENKEEDQKNANRYNMLAGQMWDLIEQLCAQNIEEFWNPHCRIRTDEEEIELEKINNDKEK